MPIVKIIPEPFASSNNLYYVLLNAEGYCQISNPCYLRKFGGDAGAVTPVHFSRAVYSNDQPACTKAVGLCKMQPGKPVTVDLRKINGSDELLYTRWEFTCLQNEEDIYIQCTGYDSTAEMFTKGSIAAGGEPVAVNRIHEELLSNSIDVFLLMNEQGLITYCSANITNILGYEVADLMGKSGFSFVHPDDLPLAVKAFDDEMSNPGTNHSIDIRFRQKDGNWKWAETKGKNLFNNPRVRSMLLNLNDISLRKRSEEALAESEIRYKSFFNQLPIPLFIISQENFQILDVNNVAVEKYGYSKKEFSRLFVHHLFSEELSMAEIEELYNNGRVAGHKTKSGRQLLVKIDKKEIDFSDADRYVLIVTDVTASAHIQLENELSFEISEILIQPKELKQNLKTALSRIRAFTGWNLAEMWIPNQEGLSIKREVVDYSGEIYNRQIGHFLNHTTNFDFPVKDYDPVVVAALKPLWIEQLSESGFEFKRKKLADSCGFQSCLIIPVVNDERIICIFSFFSFEVKPSNRNEMNLIGILGKLFGAEIEKRKNSLMLDMFFRISNDILTIAGLDGRYVQVNPAFEAFLGYTSEEAKKIHPLSYVFDKDKAAVLTQLQQLSNGIAVPYSENRVVTKAGDIKWIAWTATPILSEGIIIASHRDITAQKEVEEELRIFNERYKLVTKATNEAIWDLDLVTNEMTWSDGYKTLFGHGFDESEHGLDFWELNIHPDEREEVVGGFTDFLKQHSTPYWESEYRFRKNDGSYAHVLDKGYLIFDKENTPLRMVGAMQDITERKKLEYELLIRERNKQNQIAQAVVFAQEKERAEIGKELHDNVGQLLTTTKLYLEMLRHKLDDPIELIERGTRHINMVIHTIRNLSHSLVPPSINDLGLLASVNDLIENVQALERIDIDYVSAHELESKMEESLKLALYRIIQEQLNNIVRHAEANKVTIELFEEDNFIKLIIADNGKGFNVETVRKGLGLKNITSRTELQNGSVDIITNPDKGCKIMIQIPIIL